MITRDDSWPDTSDKYKTGWELEVCARKLTTENLRRYFETIGGKVQKRKWFGRTQKPKDPCAELRRLSQEAPKEQ
ncbi:hypothetical protein IZ6_07860 [Terrihabitans soli]|uniref:Uncharacterized protein n=1 Tax=Terrihabitans soli TaxID=708113 RepID=A0A6S6QSL8_9HYPH|nr:hypothetical protein [Terrihabitans soli]BCJ90051.1 hypothetical protein IZ6_07860 [Terrihabitans soli]